MKIKSIKRALSPAANYMENKGKKGYSAAVLKQVSALIEQVKGKEISEIKKSALPSLEKGTLNLIYASAYELYRTGHFKRACPLFRLLVLLQEDEATYWFALAASLQKNEQREEAIHAYAMSSLLQKEDPWPHFHAAECYLDCGKKEEALKAFALARSLARNNPELLAKIDILTNCNTAI